MPVPPARRSILALVLKATMTNTTNMSATARSALVEVLEGHMPSDLSYHWESTAELKNNMRMFEEARKGCSWKSASRSAYYQFSSDALKYKEFFNSELLEPV